MCVPYGSFQLWLSEGCAVEAKVIRQSRGWSFRTGRKHPPSPHPGTLKAANWSGNVVSKSSSCRLRIRCDRGSLQIVAGLDPGAERALVGEDFGARDPYAGELESGFGEKPLGNYDTEHVIKPPDAIREFTGLSSKKCLPSQSDAVQLLEERDINILRAQCAGWRVSKSESGKDCIECDWKVKDAPSGEELMKRIMAVADAENHHPKLEFDDVLLTVRAELFTHVKGGLTINDFILAAKINDIEIGDLTPKRKQKFWA